MTDQELIRALRTNGTKADGCHDCYLGYLAYQAADRLTSLMKDLGRVTRERDAAVECIQFIATYMELDSMKDIRKMIETWKADGRRRKREKDTHM